MGATSNVVGIGSSCKFLLACTERLSALAAENSDLRQKYQEIEKDITPKSLSALEASENSDLRNKFQEFERDTLKQRPGRRPGNRLR